MNRLVAEILVNYSWAGDRIICTATPSRAEGRRYTSFTITMNPKLWSLFPPTICRSRCPGELDTVRGDAKIAGYSTSSPTNRPASSQNSPSRAFYAISRTINTFANLRWPS
ncbi:hypothetical protein B0H10DRAFT_2006893 [Mycena sp. CBHHK59/15]|nr:hypothetical protein B0H10DRAFT_2006893 [Mycena sp. CBHHK59/15]